MKKRFRVLLIVFGSLALLAGFVLIGGTWGMNEVRDYAVAPVDLASIEDGTYAGQCDIGRWAISVEATVKDHRITAVRITDKKMSNLTPEGQASLNEHIIGLNNPKFDAVTGASITGKAYMIAVADALQRARR